MNNFYEEFGPPETPLGTHTTAVSEMRIKSRIKTYIPQSSNDYLRHFSENFQVYLERILAQTTQPAGTCGCGKGPDTWKCLDCFGNRTFCVGCCRLQHTSMPFHRVQKWNGFCFADEWLIHTGLVLHIGHRGQPCPLSNPETAKTEDKHCEREQETDSIPCVEELDISNSGNP